MREPLKDRERLQHILAAIERVNRDPTLYSLSQAIPVLADAGYVSPVVGVARRQQLRPMLQQYHLACRFLVSLFHRLVLLYLITTLRPLLIYTPFTLGLPESRRPSSEYQPSR